jgi:hypothetical protein
MIIEYMKVNILPKDQTDLSQDDDVKLADGLSN